MNTHLWQEVGHCFAEVIPADASCRCVVLTGAGPIFSAGIDLTGAMQTIAGGESQDAARRAVALMRVGGAWQQSWRSISACGKPVIAAIHGGCYGAALEMVAFADVRFCTEENVFQAPEVDIGLAADIGGNQMLPKVMGNDSLVREVQLSGRRLAAAEALSFGLVSR